MNISSVFRAKSLRVPSSWRVVVAFLAVAFIVAPIFYRTADAISSPQASTLETLAKPREAWVQELRPKQLEPILKFYAPDAAFLQPDGERIVGSAALRTLFQTIMASFK